MSLMMLASLATSMFAFMLQPASMAQAAAFIWARQFEGDYSGGLGLAVDTAGNVYTTGLFQGTIDVDPGPGTFILTDSGPGTYDAYISKLDGNGNFVWAAQLSGADLVQGFGLAVDGSGNVYTTGWFSGTADFDPGSGTFHLTSTGGLDVYVSKLDSNGNFVWARSWGATGDDKGNEVFVDGAGNVYTTGFFAGTADFDPGPGTLNLASGTAADAFISKLDNNGDIVWAVQLGGSDFIQGSGLTVDGAGNVYTTGDFASSADFDPGAGVFKLTSFGEQDAFVSRLDSNGNFVWAAQLGGIDSDQSLSLTVDGVGSVYAVGQFEGEADFDPGTGVFGLGSAGDTDAFITKLDANGNFIWAAQLGGTGEERGNALALDGAGNVYTIGVFRSTADFDPGPGLFNLTGGDTQDTFISKLDGSGNFVWAVQFGQDESYPGLTFIEGDDLAVDGSGTVHSTGYFGGVADFDPEPTVFSLVNDTGSPMAFISKFSQQFTPTPTPTATNTSTPTATPGSALLNNLVGYWKLDEASGTRLDSASINYLADFNTVGQAAGKINGAASFNSASLEYLFRTDNASLSTGNINFTLSAWAFMTNKAAVRPIAGKSSGTSNSQIEYVLGYSPVSNRYQFIVSNGSASGGVSANNFGVPGTNAWHFILAWHDASANQLCISVNNGSPNCVPYSGGAQDSTFQFQIGRALGNAYWQGRIDEVGFWKRVLTPAERAALYNNGNGLSYPFQ